MDGIFYRALYTTFKVSEVLSGKSLPVSFPYSA